MIVAMKILTDTFKRYLNLLASYVPTRLPVGVTEFETWANSIKAMVGPGLENVPSDDIQFILSNTIFHLAPQRCSVPKVYFVRTLRKTAANQVAGQRINDIKDRQKQQQAALAAKQAEATATPQVADAQAKDPGTA